MSHPVRKRPADNGRSALPLPSTDAGKCSKVGALLHEGILTNDGGRVLGHLMLSIVAVHPGNALGVCLEVVYCGASNSRLQTWAAQAFTSPETPFVSKDLSSDLTAMA
eukprot:5357711-Amphidinium_carterae.1